MKEIESVQYSEENAAKLEESLTALKDPVLTSEESQIFFIKNGGLTLIIRLMDVGAAMTLL